MKILKLLAITVVILGSCCFADVTVTPDMAFIGFNSMLIDGKVYGELLQKGVRLPRRYGQLVTSIKEYSPAADSVLQKGDLIHRINGIEIKTEQDFLTALKDHVAGNIMTIETL